MNAAAWTLVGVLGAAAIGAIAGLFKAYADRKTAREALAAQIAKEQREADERAAAAAMARDAAGTIRSSEAQVLWDQTQHVLEQTQTIITGLRTEIDSLRKALAEIAAESHTNRQRAIECEERALKLHLRLEVLESQLALVVEKAHSPEGGVDAGG